MRAYILAQMIIVVILAFAQQLVNIICCNGTSQSSYVFFDITLFRIVLTQLDNLGLVCFDISEQSKFMNQLDKSWPTTSDWMEVQLRVFVRRKLYLHFKCEKICNIDKVPNLAAFLDIQSLFIKEGAAIFGLYNPDFCLLFPVHRDCICENEAV